MCFSHIWIWDILLEKYVLKLAFDDIAVFQKRLDMRIESRILFSQKIIGVVGFFALIGIFVIPAIASDRFLNNSDGTVTDAKTGLMWAAKDNGIPINWPDALSYCQNYTGGGHTDWRLPNVKELQSMIHFGYHSPPVSDTAGTGQWTEGDPFTGLQSSQSSRYWSGSTALYAKTRAWDVRMVYGFLAFPFKSSDRYVWPVRAGQ